MKKNHLFILFCLPFLFVACTKDTGLLQVSYNKATAIYGDLDEVRSQPVNASVREIENPGKVYVGEELILIGEEEKGVHVIDNTDSENPQTVNFINIPGNREYFVKGDFLYAESYYDVVKLDISNPLNVVLISRAEFVFTDEMKNDEGETLLGFSFEEVTEEVNQDSDLYEEIMSGNYVYVDFARKVIPRSAVPASFAGNSSQQGGTINRVAHYNDHVYILGRSDLNIIKDDANFAVVTQRNNIGNEMETIFPYQDKLFIGSRASMEIYDVSTPDQPVQQYFFSHATSCDPVLPVGNAAYISLRTGDFSDCPGDANSLIVLDIQNLQNPQQTAEINMSSPYGMAKIGNYLFVGEGANGLTIFDATNPLNLQKVKTITEIEAYDILAHPSRADYVLVAGTGGLEQYTLEGLDFGLTSRINY